MTYIREQTQMSEPSLRVVDVCVCSRGELSTA